MEEYLHGIECTTHFWPSYFLEPQMTGMTIHDLTQDIDGGNIIHQNSVSLVKGDSLHDLACRAVKEMGNDLNILISKFKIMRLLSFLKLQVEGYGYQKTGGLNILE